MAWNKVVKNKVSGGLGFKEIIAFNLAMLAKVGWRLICNPDSLLARVLQAKYYPTMSFTDAPVGRNGRCIQIVKDPWLSILRTFRPMSRHEEMPILVADLMDLGDVTMVVGEDFLECWKWLCTKYGEEMEASDNGGYGNVKPLVAIHLLKQQWEEMVWIKPHFGTLKINCDGAWCSRTGIGGVGWVLEVWEIFLVFRALWRKRKQ
ncbi:ribonuclease H protein [Pyrus ussuriensis x Pyrus communis]|uniref:Ribonuclease H protein n=1 Tax=Pyrus ussuriensis x Pyrus communis TaxID=2448454 RepID=A0A5N5FA68_9ROSA|nr:ribonuclease H protein [Pyrus ussuriensis x Pyrus communis]